MHVPPSVNSRRTRIVVLAIVVLVVVARSAVFLLWEQALFDSDQAVIGLMAKHLSEGRAFPLFLYGANYILGVEAWMAAPVFKIAGVSVAALRFPVLLVNIAAALLLVRLLERDGGLSAPLAAVAAVFFVLPPPGASAELLDVSGVNPEPFLYVLLIWMTRHRPALCGLIVGFGFLQREFTIYAPLALLVIGGASGALFTRDGVRRTFAAARTAAEVWLVVTVLKTYSSAAGPGTTLADMYRPANNLRNLFGRICFDPSTALDGIRQLATVHWVRLFGLRVEPLVGFAIDSRVNQGVSGAWILFAAAMLIAIVRVVMWIASTKRVDRSQYFAAYLTLVGLISATSFVLARCGAIGPLRYTLFSIFGAIGMSAWFLQVERQRRIRTVWIALVAAWAVVAAIGHARLWNEYLTHPPYGFKRLMIKELQARGVHYAIADYWNAYYISFLTNEGIIVKSEDFPRIQEYDRQVDAHINEAIRVSRTACEGGQPVMPGLYFCPPPIPNR